MPGVSAEKLKSDFKVFPKAVSKLLGDALREFGYSSVTGAHFRNWLNQFLELRREDDVQVEEMDSRGFQCYEESGEKMSKCDTA